MKRKMPVTVGILSLSFALSVGLAGCAGKGNDESGLPDIQSITIHDGGETEYSSGAEDNNDAGSNSETEGSDTNGANGQEKEASVYYDGADLNGRVLEFSDTGFTMTPIHTVVYEDGSRDTWEAAPGKENEEDNIHVTYTDDTVFEIVYFNSSLKQETSRQDADKDSVKKQTVVYVFGSSQDEKNWIADKILIQRWD